MTHLPEMNVPQDVEHALVWVVAGLAAEQAADRKMPSRVLDGIDDDRACIDP